MSIFSSPGHYFAAHDTRYVFLDGAAGQQMADIYQSLQAQLSIPGYFGHNLDALEEVLADLDWIKESKVVIVLLRSPALLQHEPAKRKAFLEVLESAPPGRVDIYHFGAPGDKASTGSDTIE